ncbi:MULTISPECIES: hydantoinase/oxoprolinase family protein [Mesorhizobium]|uniref:Hydantoinase n=2 Tax=Mesorhizobium TaxID=68287 RepID=A0A1A5HWE7_RHILI|nr:MULTISPECIES: hydantoinase/oxoprolinase family protein [Mesorhizobium]ETA71552.1 N-methylhydantoinase A/acetone carboxylase, beta subunit [Mesorhizobium japonicum R7A]MBE1708386.1 hydantoinase/oxoprolinase family protein [Mesorhizobium japonicum]MBE1713555.1 hydantoinase/oxoprolinase family protein [Mesorhizobium japonicum]MUT19704.1 hydantoinase/oxoprolinase family protein [Mesorhizobium japonicum]MUT25674.1 hydantoinase/oxoprolinase family protein [Mesorhizobium japonicum]
MDGAIAADEARKQADWKVGVDIGGTFIDFCALEANSGRVASLKVLTTPEDPGAELMTGLRLLAEREGFDPTRMTRFVHGTTVGINTIIQRKGAPLALFTNAGFEDVIELARLRMPDMYSLFCSRPDPLISRDMVFGIPTRMRADGSESQAPDMVAVEKAVAAAKANGALGIIVCFLHAWRNAAQEASVKAAIARLAPDLFVFSSAEVWPVVREYERSSTAILNGYVHPRVSSYLTALEARLKDRGVPARPMLTKSNGGLMNAAEGKRACVNMLLSGTASGVIGASWLARQAGENRILTLDIGGTSADFALIIDGEPQFGTGELIGEFPLHIPSVSVSSIGVGGGSIASVDAQTVLRVGPESAGSTPGPACYGRGGERATVTDAMVVCGWLGHSEMAYGQLRIDTQLAHRAVGDLAARLGRTVEQTAQAILDIAVSEMFVEVEKLASRAGVDLRDFTLMPFGGGGPMLGAFLARELGMKRVMAPRRPGVVSALGGLVADLRGDFIRTVFTPLSGATLPAIREAFEALAHEGRGWLAAQGHDAAAELTLSCDMRYFGQSYEIEVVLSPEWLTDDDVAPIEQAFHLTHQRLYDFHDPDGEVELVDIRLSAIGAGPKLSLPETEEVDVAAIPARRLPVYTGLRVETVDLHDRQALVPGSTFHGPAVVVQEDTTFAIPAGAQARVDRHLNLLLTFAE